MRTLLGLGLVLGLAGFATAQDGKIDEKKLLGKWQPKDPKGEKFQIEFLKDGKVTFVSTGGKESKADGTYKVDGNKIVLNMKFGEKEQTMTRVVSKLTDTELVSRSDAKKDDKEDTLVRVK
jgi:uncharacterized protein (TIGR03066 family)